MRTVNDACENLLRPNSPELAAPSYLPSDPYKNRKIMLAAECMRNHTADAGWQLTLGLQSAGYALYGHNLPRDFTNVQDIIGVEGPDICVVQDKREWDCKTAGQTDPSYRFQNIESLKDRNDIFKLTVLKDAQNDPEYHRQSADEIGCHAWITYYHPQIVKHVAPYVREQHLIRTYHSVDPEVVKFKSNRYDRALLSGAIGPAYPLRTRISSVYDLSIHRLNHPGYHARGCQTPYFLDLLSHYKVAICTSSRYGYSLRKIIEATAAGCVVITDLPVDDELPFIDNNLIRVSPNIEMDLLEEIIRTAGKSWDEGRQRRYSLLTTDFYSWQTQGRRLAENIENLRVNYNANS